ncbi:hypothetical protein SO802_023503 [Lithocarpus litseifolius]|uniref:F-box domain-containing protein n=1 Tax=Lithocarpus litseifolius TaxID=425828 RepID=A0AAW2C6E1_9ROSI
MMEKEKEGERNGPTSCDADISVLPEECISNIVSLTSPKDACTACAVSPIFRAAAESNVVWDRFLPSDYHAIISRSSTSLDSLNFSSKKQLYLSLSDNPILIDGNKKSFFLDKLSGKKCYLLSARDLSIAAGHNNMHWLWFSLAESRFRKVAELHHVRLFDICGKMNTSMLSPKTNYAAYLVYKLRRNSHGFHRFPPMASVGTTGGVEDCKQTVWLSRPKREPRKQHPSLPKWRKDGWFESKLGEYFNEGGENDELQIRLMEVEAGTVKSGLIVEGIEIRPTKG